jgi:uncharacterized protein (DUF885 family)
MGFAQTPEESAATLDRHLESFFNVLVSGDTSMLFDAQPQLPGVSSPLTASAGLEYLKGAMGKDFPAIADFSYSVQPAPEELSNETTLAFYRMPPVDDSSDNRIVYYQQNMDSDLELLTTLAHEGFPGHMYQMNYFAQKDPAPIRRLLGSIAYLEGYANYTETVAAAYFGLSAAEQASETAFTGFMYALHARADIGVNYEGWSLASLQQYLASFGYADMAESIYEIAQDQPLIYLPYGLGTLSFLDLRKHAQSQLGEDFNVVEFHAALLDGGPVPLAILSERVEDWLSDSR